LAAGFFESADEPPELESDFCESPEPEPLELLASLDFVDESPELPESELPDSELPESLVEAGALQHDAGR
jgi:hypothetical protein